ncbi:MAG: hypothetical protein AAF539_03675 [Planctomycetota bacterium]
MTLCLLITVWSMSFISTDDAIAVPVRVLQTDVVNSDLPDEVLASLPQTKFPQYDLSWNGPSSQTDSGMVSWQLTVGRRTLSINTILKIDGQPWHAARRNTIELGLVTSELETTSEEPFKIATSTSHLLQRYAAATNRSLDALDINEASVLVRTMLLGPELMVLNPHFQSFRRHQRPFFDAMDHDRSDVIEADEIDAVDNLLAAYDANRNDIIEWSELQSIRGSDQEADQSEFSMIRMDATQADITFEIDFDRNDSTKSSLAITQISDALKDVVAKINHDVIVKLGDAVLTINAVQQAGDSVSDQISVGAVADGYPLLLVADPNADGRITVRERRGCQARLRAMDTNGDDRIDARETQAPLRLCFALGPIVHRELAQLRRPAESSVVAATNTLPPPDWFARMDANSDGDLSRSEFSGTDDQFRELDLDGDQLIDLNEANPSQ